ncbi:MAG: hypothetical protein BA869_01465 [Desulfuromonadales bacterium C00003107]|jgi:hypothetical protein|nr:MAG: hypothetical protein BA869_01465 [Desulfuromonadales bacterium C00003107]
MGGGGDNEVKETAYEHALADVAIQELDYYQDVVVPFRNDWIGDVTRDTGVMEDRVAGQVNADLAQVRPSALPVGVDPSSGAGMSFNPDLAAAAVNAKAAIGATQSVRNRKAAGLQGGVDVMRGENTDAQTGMQGLAKDSVSGAIGDAQNKSDMSTTFGSSFASAVGAGAAIHIENKRKLAEKKPTGQNISATDFT